MLTTFSCSKKLSYFFNDIINDFLRSIQKLYIIFIRTIDSIVFSTFMDVDVAVRHAESFAAIQDLVTT